MRSIHSSSKNLAKNNTPYRVIHKHRTKLGNPIWIIIMLSIISLFVMANAGITVHADSSVSFTVDNSDTVLELTLPSSVTLDLVPSSTNNYVSFGTSDLSILAGTNNPYGLTLTMSVPNTNLTNSSLTITNDETHNPNNIPLDSSNHPIIPTLASGTTYTENTFTTNAWGYKLSTNTNYSSVPSSLELLNTDSASNAITTTLNLAAKVDSTRPAGVYSTTLNFAMVGNAGNSLVSFRIDDHYKTTTYQAISGMTWQEWVDSIYNIDEYYINGGYVLKSAGYGVSAVRATDEIISGTYLLEKAFYTIIGTVYPAEIVDNGYIGFSTSKYQIGSGDEVVIILLSDYAEDEEGNTYVFDHWVFNEDSEYELLSGDYYGSPEIVIMPLSDIVVTAVFVPE